MNFNFYSGQEHQPYTHTGSTGRAALFIHGFMGTPVNWRTIAEAFAADGWTVEVPLLPGFGTDTPRLAEMTHRDWLQTARDTWQRLQNTHDFCVLAGHSMGGAIAIALSADLPPERLVLTAPFWHLNVPTWQKRLLPIGKHILKEFRVFEDADFNDAEVRAQFNRIAPELDLDDPAIQEAIREQVTIPLSSIDYLNRLGQLAHRRAPATNAPTLVFQGNSDDTVLPHHTRALVERLPDATLVQLDGGHDLPQGDTDTYQQVLEQMRLFVSEGVYAT
jgi:carboxylesterase